MGSPEAIPVAGPPMDVKDMQAYADKWNDWQAKVQVRDAAMAAEQQAQLDVQAAWRAVKAEAPPYPPGVYLLKQNESVTLSEVDYPPVIKVQNP